MKSAIGTAVVLLVVASAASAQTPPFVQTLVILNPSPDGDDRFGVAVATAADEVFVGAPGEDADGPHAGIAYRFDASTGELLTTYRNPSPEQDDEFGRQIAAIGDRVLIAAPFDDTIGLNRGAAYLFHRDGALLQTIFSPPGSVRFWFGLPPMAVAGNDFLIADGFSTAEGSVHLLDGMTGALLQTYPTPAFSQVSAIASAGDRVVAGVTTPDPASVYSFDRSTASLIHQIAAPTSQPNSLFGAAVALAPNHLVVGAHFDATDAPTSGRVYVYDGTGGLVREIANPSPAEFDLFGASVAVVPDGSNGTFLVVTAPLDDTVASQAGAVYVFDGDSGELRQQIFASHGYFSVFGNTIAALGSDFVATAYRAEGFVNFGAAYVFRRDNDGDRLADRQEVAMGTNPSDPDSDDDGLGDGDEVLSYGTNPLDADTDDDRLSDAVETRYGVTGPTIADTDLDGIIDGRDIELLKAVVGGLPAEAFVGANEGLRRATLALIDQAGHQIAHGHFAQAVHHLQILRRRMDGCGFASDDDDWIADCAAQSDSRVLADILVANLG